MKIVKYYKSLTFEEKTILSVKFSVILNFTLAIAKIGLSFFFGVFFMVAGVVNLFMMLSRLECYLGEKNFKDKSFKYRNRMIGLFLLLAGLEYAIYMGRLLITDVEVMKYDMYLAVSVAFVSFIELGVAIKGCFAAYGKGHYYRNAKLISMCSALTAIVLTQVAITSFTESAGARILNGVFGVAVGIVMILISGYIFLAPKISLVDKKHRRYKLQKGTQSNVKSVDIPLTHSKFYGNYVYKGKRKDDVIDGNIIKLRSPLFKWNIFVKILVIVLSEILIFPYAVGALVFHFKSSKVIKKLDIEMEKIGFEK